MNSAPCRHLRVPLAGLTALLVLVCAQTSLAEDPPAPPPAAPDALAGVRAEVVSERAVWRTDGPLRIRLVLVNTTDEVVEVPLEPPLAPTAGVVLPPQLAFGHGPQPALHIVFENEEPQPVLATDEPAPGLEPVGGLKLGPRAALGLELNLRDYLQSTRYPGTYRVEWRPLEGRLGLARLQIRVDARKDAILVTDYGRATFRLDYEGAPQNIENFLELAGQGFYDGKTFHRVIPGFILQGGSPNGESNGVRPDGKLVPAEFRPSVPVEAGTLLMARKDADPNSASAQFFIALTRLPALDGKYTVIGRAQDAESLRTFQQLASVPTSPRDRPLTPLVIRSVNLVEAEADRTLRLELQNVRRTTSKDGAKAPASGKREAAAVKDSPSGASEAAPAEATTQP